MSVENRKMEQHDCNISQSLGDFEIFQFYCIIVIGFWNLRSAPAISVYS